MYPLSLFIFRRDLRVMDNTALIAALQSSAHVLPCFIVDPRQCDKNPYKSLAAIRFMLESLQDLQQQLGVQGGQLYFFQGKAEVVVEEILSEKPIAAVYLNRDYTPFSRRRDKAIQSVCDKFDIPCHVYDDALLHNPEATLKKDATPYRVFSQFYRHLKGTPIAKPRANTSQRYYHGQLHSQTHSPEIVIPELPTDFSMAITGGRASGLRQLQRLSTLNHYDQWRDFPAKAHTTMLSAHLKFGTCSVREIFHAIQNSVESPEGLIRELYWRDFFTTIAFYFPRVFGHAFQPKYDALAWDNNMTHFEAWCQGKTGFPIVDAGMRELNHTGYMHNRVRLITASFLVKDLAIDWRWGERYFAQQLIDYDPAVNNGNWQWVAGTGTDAQPYFRVFNPWLQQKKFDPDCAYIKHWVPELQLFPTRTIHQWQQCAKDHSNIHYPAPMLDHAEKTQEIIQRYQRTSQN